MLSVRSNVAILAIVTTALVGLAVGSIATAQIAGGDSKKVVVQNAAESDPRATLANSGSFTEVISKVTPAVVSVMSARTVGAQASGGELPPGLREFFGRSMPDQFDGPRERREQGLGSGVIVDPNGYIITNNHVVEKASEVKVTLADQREFPATVVGTDPRTDIAILKIQATNLPTVAVGDSSKAAVGDLVFAIGNPFGVGQTVTMGIVSATGRGNLRIVDYEDFIQTDAAINPGNSGGALINAQGHLIAINTAILSGGGGGNQGIGFAVPTNMARQVMKQIVEQGKVTRGWLGVAIQPVTPSIAKAFKLKDMKGALVSDVNDGSPAQQAGVSTGDVILSVNGEPIVGSRELSLKIGMMQPNETVTLKVAKDGQEREVRVKLGEQPGSAVARAGGPSGARAEGLEGMRVEALTPEIANELRLPRSAQGVVVSQVDPSSPAGRAGLNRGDVIQEVNRNRVTNMSDYNRYLRDAAGDDPIVLLVNRGGRTMYVAVERK